MIVGSLFVNNLPIFLAINVFPVPGGPWSIIPFTCLMPSLSTIFCFIPLELKALLKIPINSLFNPPIPIFSKSKSSLNNSLLRREESTIFKFISSVYKSNSVDASTNPSPCDTI